MEYFNFWKLLVFIALILLVVYWKKRNAVWGGFTAGIIIGFLIALFSEFNWFIVGKVATLGTMIGFGAELLGKLYDKSRKNDRKVN